MSLLFYRRPDYVAKMPGPMNLTQCQIYVERTQKHRRAIPPELSFENIVQNRALPPCTLQDFMDYLVYVSHDAENLQFWLWLQSYTKKFYASPPSEQALSPPWSHIEGLQPTGFDANQPPRTKDKSRFAVNEYEINFDQQYLPPTTPPGAMSSQFDKQSFISGITQSARSAADSVEDANAQAGLKWQSFTIQPHRSELNHIINTYLSPSSPRELNLSHRTRTAVLHALQHTTHPSAFSPLLDIVEGTLRGQSHPNFIRYSICNGNKPRVLFVRNSGIAHVIGGFLLAILMILSSLNRWWRLWALPLWLIGFSTSIAAYKGLCVTIHTGHRRALKPWEQYLEETTSLNSYTTASDDEATLGGGGDYNNSSSTSELYTLASFSAPQNTARTPTFQTQLPKRSTSTLRTNNNNNNDYENEPWFTAYKKKPLLKKIFAKNVWVQEASVRVMQDRIVVQSYIISSVISLALTTITLACPVVGVI